MEDKEVCRLCLKLISDDNFQILNDTKKNMLLYIVPQMNLEVNSAPNICDECSEFLKTSYEFKTICLQQNFIAQHQTQEIQEDKKCCLCQAFVETDVLVHSEKEQIFLKIIMKECFPDLNMQSINNLTWCAACLHLLKNMFSLVSKCQESEDKIKMYIKSKGIKETNKINLQDVYKFARFCFVKIECANIKNEEESEVDHIEVVPDIKLEGNDEEVGETDEDDEDFTATVKTEYIELNGDKDDREHTETTARNLHDGQMGDKISSHKCTECHYKTKKLDKLNVHLLLKHKDPLSVKKYKCTKCPYEAKYKHYLQDHTLTHLDSSEITMFKCFTCSFETKRKSALKMHLLTHKDPSELKMFKCEACDFETKWRDCLRKHQARHKGLEDGITYKCQFCSYETNKKHLLRPHLLKHKNRSDIKMYKCDKCPYEAKQKSNLQKHLVMHMEPSEMPMYKCTKCPYATKWKSGIKSHEVKHKKRYSCDKCDFLAEERCELYRHQVVHAEDAQLKIYACDQCSYSTKYRTNLNKHKQTHKDRSEIPSYKCNRCEFETKHKASLKHHGFVHLDQSELTLLKCEFCSYETYRKCYLLKHVDRHKSARAAKH